MHPAYSVIFLTTLIGVGQGLFLALFTGHLYSVIKVVPMQADPQTFYGLGSLIALVFMAGGLVASFFHLGHPERAWRAIAMWRTSWLSREVIVLPAFMGILALYGLIHYSGWNPALFNLGSDTRRPVAGRRRAGTMLAFALFICTGMIYACIKFLQEWASPLTVVNYTLLGAASGFTLATAFSAVYAPELVRPLRRLGGDHHPRGAGHTRRLPVPQCPHQIQVHAADRNRRAPHTDRAEGPGFMGGSVNTRDFFHGKSVVFMKSIKWIFLVWCSRCRCCCWRWAWASAAFAVFVGLRDPVSGPARRTLVLLRPGEPSAEPVLPDGLTDGDRPRFRRNRGLSPFCSHRGSPHHPASC
jgi:sulfite dehydrogenase (quinone) subunit SoeC